MDMLRVCLFFLSALLACACAYKDVSAAAQVFESEVGASEDDTATLRALGAQTPVGCDMMLNSTAREDKCLKSRGNGTNCRTTEGIIDSQDLVKGYNDILLIPSGSTSIKIEEVKPSPNYLALRAVNGTYYLNGHYNIHFSGRIMIAGALWTYERSQDEVDAPDKLRCLGPTTDPLYLSLLLQDENVGIKYEYSNPGKPTSLQNVMEGILEEVEKKVVPVGCDMMLNSTAREDKCRKSQGNGTNCRTTEGIIDLQDLVNGYNDILLIPSGSTSIKIEEVKPTHNYLALRSVNGTYYLNGNYHIDFPRRIMIAGAIWTYERSQDGFAAPDKLCCLGPTTEPLYLSLMLQDENVAIKFEYSSPDNPATPQNVTEGILEEVETKVVPVGCDMTLNSTAREDKCQKSRGNGTNCRTTEGIIDSQDLVKDLAGYQWVEDRWGACSQRYGRGGVRSREITCQEIINNSKVPDKLCFDLLGPKPEVTQKCNEDAPYTTWYAENWTVCDQLCGKGKQTRQVVCYRKKNDVIEVLDDEACTEKKLEEEQPCIMKLCHKDVWFTSGWSGCDSCTSKFRTRSVVCSMKSQTNESLCSNKTRPVDHEECNKDELPPCEVQWYATQWSKCSATCGVGVQTRKVFCGNDNARSEGVQVVEDSMCDILTKYNDTRPCTVPKEECPSQWFAGPWSECTGKCGQGLQYRRVMCFRGDKMVSDCDASTVLDSVQICASRDCFIDAVSVTTEVMTPYSTMYIGADLRLTCKVYGFPKPDVHWTKDGANIQTDSRIFIIGSAIMSQLTVKQVSITDSGLYACHASNSYSSQSDTARINVLSKLNNNL